MTGMRTFITSLAELGAGVAREHVAKVSRQEVREKAHHDWVSQVDGLVEAAIVARIRARFPDHRILGEEGGDQGAAASDRPLWIIDPIDGTTNFIHGLPHFAVSIAWCDGAGVAAGAVLDVMRDELFLAERGQGLTLNGEPARATACTALDRALVGTALAFRFPEARDDVQRVFATVQGLCDDQRRGGSASLDLAWVASGRLDAYYELGIHPWDIAAGLLLVREGGGAASDYRGRGDGLLDQRSVVAAATPTLHRALLDQVAPLVPWLARPPFGAGA